MTEEPNANAGTDSSAASVTTEGNRATVSFRRHLSRPAVEIWRSLTQPDGLSAWFPCDIETEAWQVGALLTFPFPGHEEFTLTGTVLECDEPRLLSYTWGEEVLRFELTPSTTEVGTELMLSDELDRGIAARNAAGWQICLEQLAGRAPADDAWKPLFEQYVAQFEPVLGPQEGPPAEFVD